MRANNKYTNNIKNKFCVGVHAPKLLFEGGTQLRMNKKILKIYLIIKALSEWYQNTLNSHIN